MTIPLTWQVLLYNNSAQPVTIDSIDHIEFSNYGMAVQVGEEIGPSSKGSRTPFTIPAKGFESFSTTVQVNAPKAYAEWYRRAGLCDTKVVDPHRAAERAGFTATGGTVAKPSRAGIALKIRTSDGYEVSTQAQWEDPIGRNGPHFNLPKQEN